MCNLLKKKLIKLQGLPADKILWREYIDSVNIKYFGFLSIHRMEFQWYKALRNSFVCLKLQSDKSTQMTLPFFS
jgi:hypothetical protein